MKKTVGYARVHLGEQDAELIRGALLKAGCAKRFIFIDQVVGASQDCPAFQTCRTCLSEGDTLVVWRMECPVSSLPHLFDLIGELCQQGIGFRTLSDEVIDTTTETGHLVCRILKALAQFDQRRAHQLSGGARRRKRKTRITPDHPTVQTVKTLSADYALSVTDICKQLNISRATYYRYLALSGATRGD